MPRASPEQPGYRKGDNMMTRVIIVLVVGILQVSLMAGVAQAQSSNLSDGFESFDEARWSKGNHNLGVAT